jgi:hypothetical protein
LHVKQVSGAFITLSKKVTVEGNVFFTGPRAGITLNDQWGGSKLIRHNVVFEMVRGTSDHGPFILWNRQQYEESLKEADIIEENFFIGTPGAGKDGGGKGINVDDGAHNIISRNNVLANGFHKIKGSKVIVSGNLLVLPIVTACVYFSHYNRLPAQNQFVNNTCITNFPPYAFGLGGPALRGMCDNKNNFLAASNKFYFKGASDSMETCARSWSYWFRTLKQDQGSFYQRSKNLLPSVNEVSTWILAMLHWVPM